MGHNMTDDEIDKLSEVDDSALIDAVDQWHERADEEFTKLIDAEPVNDPKAEEKDG